MLHTTRDNIAYCYQRAEEAKRLAARSGRPEEQQLHHEAESRWLSLAQSYELAHGIDQYRAYVNEKAR
jgi:hypothetical protein